MFPLIVILGYNLKGHSLLLLLLYIHLNLLQLQPFHQFHQLHQFQTPMLFQLFQPWILIHMYLSLMLHLAL